MRKRLIFFLSAFLAYSMVFCENYVCASLGVERGNGQIKVVNNTLEYIRVKGSSGAVQPRSTGYIPHGCTIECNSNVDYVITRNNGNITVITVNSVGGSSGPANTRVDVHCVPCHGSGNCPKCNGKGYTVYRSRNDHGKARCDRCGGSGKCPYCHGTGRK